ncbi:hypothetical protein M407DRAFT_176806 [Tulasnella calospora MUT 4182]|uniref:Carbohydrate-binding module family 13 protein n=1 Tax=Tulasnella calospora MUT 4182 TaxID=1051891 RepID=A0A0C3M564_9AGAM|nr:hypothetical protein M407DRAFT_176806 [Tulasnella calospora MUT 4182]
MSTPDNGVASADASPLEITIPPPPSYSPRSSYAGPSGSGGVYINAETGFPGGYFLIKNVGANKVLDVARGEHDDGTDVILWDEKESSLVEVMRDPEADNQLFFMDYNGHICSKVAGLPIDIDDGHLVVRRHRPVTYPFPNHYSHPLPRFSYDRSSGLVRVAFACDPSYPAPSAYPSQAWKERDYVLSAVPLKRDKSLAEASFDFLATAASRIKLNPFGSPIAAASAAHVERGDYDLRDDETLEEERPDHADDDSPSRRREVRMLNLPLGWMEKERGSLAIVTRRKWEIVPVLHNRNVTRPI